MAIIPEKIADIIAFAIDKRNKWDNIDPTTIGLSQVEIDELASLTSAITSAQGNAVAMRSASKDATSTRNEALESLLRQLRSMILSVEAFASKAANPKSVYTAASLPFPKTPQELDAPPAPVDVTWSVQPLGGVSLKWKVPSKDAYRGATYYIVQRTMSRVGEGPGPVVTVGQPAEREFLDDSIPPGFDQATYNIFATRNNKTSPAAIAVVNFGVIAQTPATSNAVPEGLAEAA